MQTRHPLWRTAIPALILLATLAILGAGSGGGVRATAAPADGGLRPAAKPRPQPARAAPPAASQDLPPAGRLHPAPPLRAGGPDAFGYLVSDSTEPNGPTFNYLPASTLVLTGDDATTLVNLPFPINIYDRATSTLTVNTNGLVYLGACASSITLCAENYSLPNVHAPAALVAPFWDDLVLTTTNAGVFTGVFGNTPTRSYIVEWRNATFYQDPNSTITAEIIFHENSNEIDFEYLTESGTLGNGSNATIGIQNAAQTIGLMYSYHESVIVPNLAVRILALVSPGDQSSIAAPCADVRYSGMVSNPFTTTTTFQLGVADSNPGYGSVVTPITATIAPGSNAAFVVALNVPPNAPITSTNVTTLTVVSTNPAAPLSEAVHLTTQIRVPAADFVPPTVNGTGQAGGTLTYTLRLTNRIGPAADFRITTGGNSWPSSVVPTDTTVLAPGAGITVTVRVTIPNGTPLGESDVLVLTATAQLAGSCGFSGTATLTTFNSNQVGRGPLPEARARHALVDFPPTGRVYELGGVTVNNNRNVPIEEYDARSDTWTARSTLVRPVSNIGGAALGDTIYIPGGFDGAVAVSLLQTYQPASDTPGILESDPLPAPRYGAAVVALAGKLYVIGGADNVTTTRTVYVFDPSGPAAGRWARRADMPTPRAFLGAAAVNGLIYAAGGIGDVDHPFDLATLEIYDPAADTWTTGAPLLTPRGGLAVVGLDSSQPCGGYLYAFGGGWLTPLPGVERYNPATGTWANIAPLSVPRRTLAASFVSNGHLLLVTGGYNDSELRTVDAVGCGGSLPLPTPTPLGGVPTFTPTPTCTAPFSDVQPSDYFYPAVLYLACHGILSGYGDGTFRPYANMTRAQLAKVVVLSEDWLLVSPAQGHFRDVPPSNPFYAVIETAYSHGILSGYADGTFGWGNSVTRSQIAKIVVLAQSWALQNPSPGDFSDVPPGSPFYTYIETAFAHGILSGYGDGTFRPYNPATRGQVSKVVYFALGAP